LYYCTTGTIDQNEFLTYWKDNIGFADEPLVSRITLGPTILFSFVALAALSLLFFTVYRAAYNTLSSVDHAMFPGSPAVNKPAQPQPQPVKPAGYLDIPQLAQVEAITRALLRF
jgi:hypothetical protein